MLLKYTAGLDCPYRNAPARDALSRGRATRWHEGRQRGTSLRDLDRGIWVFGATGKALGVIAVPEQPANLAWGDGDWCTLYITARTSLYRLRLNVPGIPV